jgi:hypothetical protein
MYGNNIGIIKGIYRKYKGQLWEQYRKYKGNI